MKVAVIDIGTARLKILIAAQSEQAPPAFINTSIDLPPIEDADQWRSKILSAFSQARDFILQQGATRTLAYGTEGLRSAGAGSSAFALAEEAFGKVVLLSPELEARSFHRSVMATLGSAEPIVSCDVGGGSVQLVWGDEADSWGSAPIGTFALERLFQESPEHPAVPGTQRFSAMEAQVESSLQTLAGSAAPTGRTLVVGSNIMSDFFQSALGAIGLTPSTGAAGVRFRRAELDQLCDVVLGREFESVYHLFPKNPRFMHGADKLLVIVRSAATLLEASDLVATNLSVSKGIGVLALESPAELQAFGFEL